MRAASALVGLLLLPMLALPAAAEPITTVDTDCLGPVDLVLCVTAEITLDLVCRPNEAHTHALCDAPFTWATEGRSELLLPGQAQHAAGAILEWCRPDAFCQGYGVGVLIESCSFGGLTLATSCRDTGTFNLYPGPIPLASGQCMPVTLSGYTRADGFLVAPQLTFGNSVATAEATNTVETTFCMP